MRFETPQTTPFFLTGRFHLRMLSFVGIVFLLAIMLNGVSDRRRAQIDEERLEAREVAYEVRRELTDQESSEDLTLPVEETELPVQWADADTDDSKTVTQTSGNQDTFKSRNRERSEDADLFQEDFRAPKRREPNEFRQTGVSDATSRERSDDLFQDSTQQDLSKLDDQQPDDSLDRSFENNSPHARKGRLERDREGVRSTRVIEENRFRDETPDFQRPRPSNDDRRRGQDAFDDAIPQSDPLDRRQTRDAWIDEPADVEPFREDFASVHIKKEYLDLVKDNELGIRRDEAAQFYWLLDHARRVSSVQLDQAGRRDVQYGNLMNDPDGFRGEPITIEGDLWRLYEYDAGRNDYNVSRMYEGWVFTSDSGNHPYRIVCTSLGRGIEPGENLRIPVRITGYFFKREAYPSNGGVHVAPTVLARRIAVNPMPNGLPLMAKVLPYTLSVIMAIGLALLVTVVAFAIGDERTMQAGLSRVRRHPYLSFADIAVPATVPVEESLKEFAESERRSAISGAYGPLLSRQAAREHAVHEYAASQQVVMDQEQKQHRRQRKTVQHWAARQKEIQTEIESLQASRLVSPVDSMADDELNSDKLDPARNTLSKFDSQTSSSFVSTSSATPLLPLQTSGASALELSAAAQIERDRRNREKEVLDQIHRQQLEAERLRTEIEKSDHIDHSRHEHERGDLVHERTSFDRMHHEPEAKFRSETIAPLSDPIENEYGERYRVEREHHHHSASHQDRLVDQSNTNEIDESELMDSLTDDSLMNRHHVKSDWPEHSDVSGADNEVNEFETGDSTSGSSFRSGGRKRKHRRN